MTDLKIVELTDEHRASFPIWRERWTAIGRSTVEADWDAAAAAIGDAYVSAGYDRPRVFRAVSPLHGAIVRQTILDVLNAGDIDDARWEEAELAAMAATVDDVARLKTADAVGWHTDMFYGNDEAGWMSLYDWFAHHGLEDEVEPLQPLIRYSQAAGWCWMHAGFTVISDRPATLHDESTPGSEFGRRLHNETGPSVTYRDGWGLYHWHGQLVPEWVIEDCTVDRIASEANTEIRRCAIERYGWDRYLEHLGLVPVDVADDPGNPGHTLSLYTIPDAHQVYEEPVRMLVMENASLDRDGTRRTFAETVPDTIDSAIEAAAWQFDIPVDEYRSMVRAT